ncbi:WD40-repeat-containing domain protein [Chytriomyces sp. MP71]|nr:WD40-repeat-containing domain protein [Chytriomyces sp. MP71]
MFSVDEQALSLSPITKHEFGWQEDSVQSICVNPKEKTIVVGVNCADDQIKKGNNANCRIFTLKNDCLLLQTSFSTTDGLNYCCQRVASFSPDGKYLVTVGSDGKLSVFNWPELGNAMPPLDADGEIYDANFDSTSNLLVALSHQKCFVINLAKGKTIWSIDQPVVQGETDAAEFRGARFGSGASEGWLFVAVNAKNRKKAFVCKWKTDKWSMERSRQVSTKPITAFTISNDGDLLGFGASDSSLSILDSNSLINKRKIANAHSFPITALAFSPTGRTLVSGSADGSCNVVAVPRKDRNGGMSGSLLWFLIVVAVILAILILLAILFSVDGGNDL